MYYNDAMRRESAYYNALDYIDNIINAVNNRYDALYIMIQQDSALDNSTAEMLMASMENLYIPEAFNVDFDIDDIIDYGMDSINLYQFEIVEKTLDAICKYYAAAINAITLTR